MPDEPKGAFVRGEWDIRVSGLTDPVVIEEVARAVSAVLRSHGDIHEVVKIRASRKWIREVAT